MAKKQQNQRTPTSKESTRSATLLKAFFGISFITLGLCVFNEAPLNWTLGIFAVDILVSLAYVIINKHRITESKVVHTNVRRIVAFLIMLITMFFYAFALWRVGQYTPMMQATIFVGGAIVYYAVFDSTKTVGKSK